MFRLLPLVAFVALVSAAFIPAAPLAQSIDPHSITWKKTVIEGKFRSEGVAVADVNKDGKLDVLIGDSWYEAPDWTPHDIRKRRATYGDGLHELQRVLLLLGRRRQRRRLARPDRHRLPRHAVLLVREPQGQGRPLEGARRSGTAPATRRRCTSTCSATASACWSWAGSPRARDNEGQMAWFTPGSDPTAALGDAPDQRAEPPGKEIPGTRSSRTAWASATSTATAATT